MPYQEAEIARIVEHVWQTFLALDSIRIDPEIARALEHGGLAGCVQIGGAWHGTVVLHCSAPLARQAASILFAAAPERVTPAEVRDALGELANMAGGNIKALLPDGCTLGLPQVMTQREVPKQLRGTRLAGEVAFECLGEPLRVGVYERVMAVV